MEDITTKVYLDLSGKYNKEEIDKVGEMLLDSATPEQQELFGISEKFGLPVVFAPICMMFFQDIDRAVAKNGARSLDTEEITSRFFNFIRNLARACGVEKDEYNREGGFRDRAVEAMKEIGHLNLRLRATGKSLGISSEPPRADAIPDSAASPAPVKFDLAQAEKEIRESANPAQRQILAILARHGISPIMGPRFELARDLLLKKSGISHKLADHAGKVLAQDYAEIMGCRPAAKDTAADPPVIVAFREFMAVTRDSGLDAMACESQAVN